MKDILFRGKRVDNDEWVFGVPAKDEHGEMVVIESIFDFDEYDCRGAKCLYVEESTVGQYTGLTDKNGKKIFEGDIINVITLDTEAEQRAVVCFGNFIDENNGDEYIGFFIDFDGIKTTAAQLAMEECKNRIEVIGNIHDNPELLEVEE